jgi:hypothetical protein
MESRSQTRLTRFVLAQSSCVFNCSCCVRAVCELYRFVPCRAVSFGTMHCQVASLGLPLREA